MPTLSAFTGRDYAYGYGRVGVLQEYLLTEGDVERLLLAPDFAACTRLLAELKIAKSLEWTDDPRQLIHELESWLQHEMTAMVPKADARIFDILWLKSDTPLLAYLLKAHHGLTAAASVEPTVTATAFEPGALRELVQTGRSQSLPKELVDFVSAVRGDDSLTAPQIDTAVARFVAAQQTRLAADSGSELVQRYVAHHIDLVNIHIAHRLTSRDRPQDHLLAGGNIPVQAFTADPERLVELVRGSSLPNSLIDALVDVDQSSALLQRALAKAIAVDIARMRDCVLTIEPLFAFATIAQSQFKVLRTLIVGKGAGLSLQEMRAMLPPFLSASPFTS